MQKHKGVLGKDYFIGVFRTSCVYESDYKLVSIHGSKIGACNKMIAIKRDEYLQHIRDFNEFANKNLIEEAENHCELFDSPADYIETMSDLRIKLFNRFHFGYRYGIVYLED